MVIYQIQLCFNNRILSKRIFKVLIYSNNRNSSSINKNNKHNNNK